MSTELASIIIQPVDKPDQKAVPFIPELAEVNRLIRADEARRIFGVDGSLCTVAVLDTGLRTTHRDFFGRVRAGANFTGDNGGDQSDPTDGQGHGTNVAGIICAGDIHTGIAPGAGVAALKVLDNHGSGHFGAVHDALVWVRDNARTFDISVVCMSLGDSRNLQDDSSVAGDGIETLIGALYDLDIAVCIAAGNDYFLHGSEQGMGYPAIFRKSISVGAVYDSAGGSFSYGSGAVAHSTGPDRITPFSQRLHTSTGGASETDIFAPGAPVTSSGILNDFSSSIQHGTSQATPAVAGVILLLQSFVKKTRGSQPSVAEVRRWLVSGSVAIHDGDDEHDNVEHTNQTYRRVDALASLLACSADLQT